MRKFFAIGFILSLLIPAIGAQDCGDYYKKGDCMLDKQDGYEVYSQSRSVSMGLRDTVELNIVFYGQKEYILSLCANREMYPIHFVLIDPDTEETIYDNANDKYIESLGIGFDVSKSIRLRVDVLAREVREEEIGSYTGCLGLLVQYRNY